MQHICNEFNTGQTKIQYITKINKLKKKNAGQ